MEITELRYFFNVATSGSFAAGAKLSHVSPPAMSKAVKKLEEQLDTTLFIRTTRSVQLTTQGELLVAHCRKVFAQIERLKADLAAVEGQVTGELRIGAMEVFSTFLLPRAISRIVAEHRGLRPLSYEMVPQRQERLLSEGRIDIGLTIGGGGSAEVEYHDIGQSKPVLVCGRAHPLFEKGRISRAQLQRYPSVVPRFFELEHLPTLDQFPEARYPRLRGATIELLQMGVQLALDGQYLGCFPEISVRQHISAGALKALRGIKIDAPFHLRALTRKNVPVRPAIQCLIDELRQQVRAGRS